MWKEAWMFWVALGCIGLGRVHWTGLGCVCGSRLGCHWDCCVVLGWTGLECGYELDCHTLEPDVYECAYRSELDKLSCYALGWVWAWLSCLALHWVGVCMFGWTTVCVDKKVWLAVMVCARLDWAWGCMAQCGKGKSQESLNSCLCRSKCHCVQWALFFRKYCKFKLKSQECLLRSSPHWIQWIRLLGNYAQWQPLMHTLCLPLVLY